MILGMGGHRAGRHWSALSLSAGCWVEEPGYRGGGEEPQRRCVRLESPPAFP